MKGGNLKGTEGGKEHANTHKVSHTNATGNIYIVHKNGLCRIREIGVRKKWGEENVKEEEERLPTEGRVTTHGEAIHCSSSDIMDR